MSWLNLAIILLCAVCYVRRLRFVGLDKAIYLLWRNQRITKRFTQYPHALFSHRCLRISELIYFEKWMSDMQPVPICFILPRTSQLPNNLNMLEWFEVATCKTNRRCGFMSRTVLDYESDTAVISGPLGFPAASFCMTDKQLLHMDRRPISTTIW